MNTYDEGIGCLCERGGLTRVVLAPKAAIFSDDEREGEMKAKARRYVVLGNRLMLATIIRVSWKKTCKD
jgi:hypothetical protein